jgi:hypothetical protein
LIIIQSTLFLASCERLEEYPYHWKPRLIERENTCDIAGTYYNSGEDKGGTPASVSEVLRNTAMGVHTSDDAAQKVAYVHVSQPDDDTLEFSFWNDQNVLYRRASKSKGDYKCTPEGVRLPFSAFQRWDSFDFEYSKGLFYISKSTDGELIVNRYGITVALHSAPILGGESLWYRFRQVR